MYAQDPSTPDADRIDAYRQQMMEMYRLATLSSPTVQEEEDWLDSRYPAPDIERDKQAIAPVQSAPTSDTAPAPPSYIGYLRVYTFTGGGAEPIVGARVIVTHLDGDAQTIYANLTTNADGFTPVIALPSVDPALTLRPGVAQPYVLYSIRVTADGFQPIEHRNVPIYGNNYATQPVAMIPILPGLTADTTQQFISGGPTNL